MPRYVLLRHELPLESGRASHWDFMLEQEGVLWTWALETLPQLWQEQLRFSASDASNEVSARRLSDHRLAYLDYEGEVSEDRGKVMRVAEGNYTVVTANDDVLQIKLAEPLQGNATLTRCSISNNTWNLITEPASM